MSGYVRLSSMRESACSNGVRYIHRYIHPGCQRVLMIRLTILCLAAVSMSTAVPDMESRASVMRSSVLRANPRSSIGSSLIKLPRLLSVTLILLCSLIVGSSATTSASEGNLDELELELLNEREDYLNNRYPLIPGVTKSKFEEYFRILNETIASTKSYEVLIRKTMTMLEVRVPFIVQALVLQPFRILTGTKEGWSGTSLRRIQLTSDLYGYMIDVYRIIIRLTGNLAVNMPELVVMSETGTLRYQQFANRTASSLQKFYEKLKGDVAKKETQVAMTLAEVYNAERKALVGILMCIISLAFLRMSEHQFQFCLLVVLAVTHLGWMYREF